MATKRRTKSRPKSSVRRRRTTMSAAPRKRRVRRRKSTKKGFLSAVGTETKAAFNSMVSGSVGGGLYLLYEDQTADAGMTPEKKGLWALAGAYAVTVMGGKPNVGAGIMGAAAYDYFKTKGLLGDESEQMRRQQWADPLQNVPVMLSDNEMYLAAGGDPNFALSQSNMDLADNYLPAYADTTTY